MNLKLKCSCTRYTEGFLDQDVSVLCLKLKAGTRFITYITLFSYIHIKSKSKFIRSSKFYSVSNVTEALTIR